MAQSKLASSPSSRETVRRGRQEPRRVYREGEVAYSEVDDAVALGEDLGISPFPWQRYILTDWCACDQNGFDYQLDRHCSKTEVTHPYPVTRLITS